MPESNIVFSTDPDFNKKKKSSAHQNIPSKQNLRIHLDRRRGGKIVTLIKGYRGTNQQLSELCSQLKKKFSIGGTVKDGIILLQGNIRDKVLVFLGDQGHTAKPSGG